jgi:hypothetical protein
MSEYFIRYGEEDSPEVIEAKAKAGKMEAEARSQLHPTAQAIYAVFDGVGLLISRLWGIIVLVLLVILCLGANFLAVLLGG